jgi:hypothetical protein
MARAPVVEAPVVEAPVVEAPVVEAPVVEAPVVEAPVVEATVARAGKLPAGAWGPFTRPPVQAAPGASRPALTPNGASKASAERRYELSQPCLRLNVEQPAAHVSPGGCRKSRQVRSAMVAPASTSVELYVPEVTLRLR